MKERLIDRSNPQPEKRGNVILAKDWEYFSETDYLYEKAVIFRERLLDPIARVERGQSLSRIL
jgi:PHD/YefM family antitoxin component YafN of YafNO toxin-antitoxin module